jgi:hypothetical protein
MLLKTLCGDFATKREEKNIYFVPLKHVSDLPASFPVLD